MRCLRFAQIFAFPITLTIGILLIPVVTDYDDHDLAARAASSTFRWVAGHLLSAAAFGLGVHAATLILTELRESGYQLPAIIDLFLAFGAGLFAAGLGIDGIGPVIMAASGAPTSTFFDASGWWVSGIFAAATALFGMGLISLTIHTNRAGLVAGPWRYVIFISSLFFVTAPIIPSGWALYGLALAATGIFIPIGIAILKGK